MAVDFNTLKTVSTWLKYAGMAFSTYVTIYALSRKTVEDVAHGFDKKLTTYGRRYRVALVISLLFTIAVSATENYADRRIDADRSARRKDEVEKAVKVKLDEFGNDLFGVLKMQASSIAHDLNGIDSEINKTSANVKDSILQTTEFNNRLLEHRLRDIAQANKDIDEFEIRLSPVGVPHVLQQAQFKDYYGSKSQLDEQLKLACERKGPDSLCPEVENLIRIWDDSRVAATFYYLDPNHNHLSFFIQLTLNKADVQILSRFIASDPFAYVPNVYWSVSPDQSVPWRGVLSGTDDAGTIIIRPDDYRLFKNRTWLGEDINASSLSVLFCDDQAKESADIRMRHLRASPAFGSWKLEIKGRNREGSLLKTYEARPVDVVSQRTFCRKATYAIY